MAAEPTAREIARRLIDEVLAERSMHRPAMVPASPGTSGVAGAGEPGPPVVAEPEVDPVARAAARRLVDEVLTSHGVRVGARGAQPEEPPSPPPRQPVPPAGGRADDDVTAERVDPAAAAAARRIVDEVLREHGSEEVGPVENGSVENGPPPAPTREERAEREEARTRDTRARPAAVLIGDVRTDVDPAVAARRIVERVLAAHAAVTVEPATAVGPGPEPQGDDGPIPDELFAPSTPFDGDEEPVSGDVDEDPVPGAVDGEPAPGEPLVVDVTDPAGADTESTRTAARIVAEVLAARSAAPMAAGGHGPLQDDGAPSVDAVAAPEDEGRAGTGDVSAAAAGVSAEDENLWPTDDVWPAEDVWPTDDVWLESDAAGDDRSAVVAVPPDGTDAGSTTELDPDVWPQPSPPRRTGRWLVTTVLGAVALAYVFPLAVRAVRDLVALS